MIERLYDRLLIVLAWAGPFCLVLLGAWQASLETWYFVPKGAENIAFAGDFASDVLRWSEAGADDGPSVTLIVDRDCPCTRPTIAKVEAALHEIEGQRVPLRIAYLDAPTSAAFAAVVDGIPATPTLIVTDGDALLYVGPAVSGSTCTGAEQRMLGLATIAGKPTAPILNFVDRGCYCAL
ncbi:DUF6436 domain-containing protein [Zavarzinia marina]|uniref:DUF6436 domain-containing protein n=1 Tax=Zavarzinia marina TaxID=2911065 RepID=UPI001F27F459|nr:DUF6436 domain-containing protein [Zavarzinia marina]